MEIKRNEKAGGLGSLEGVLGGISDILIKLGELAEKGETLKRTGDIKWGAGNKDIKGVYGFSIIRLFPQVSKGFSMIRPVLRTSPLFHPHS